MKKLILVVLVLLFAIPAAFAETNEITVKLPEFDVTLNGTIINNATEPYPFLHYKGITYIPMTWDLANALGLKLKWNSETGLNISKNTDMTVYEQKEKVINDVGRSLQAKVVTFPVTINDKAIDNSTEKYPLINFRNVTYFPMTYGYMVTEFGSGYKWNSETGLSVSADPHLNVHIPKPTTFTLTSSFTEVNENHGMAKDMIIIEPFTPESDDDWASQEKDYLAIGLMSGISPRYEDYIVTTKIDLYNLNDEYMHSGSLTSPTIYPVQSDVQYRFALSYHSSLAKYDQFTVTVTLTPPSVARAEYKMKYGDVEVEYVDNKFDVAKYKADGAVYAYSAHLDAKAADIDADLVPYLALARKHYVFIGDEAFSLVRYDTGILDYRSIKDSMTKLVMVDDIYVDQTLDSYNLRYSNNNAIVSQGISDVLYLYDNELNIIKIVINTASYQ